MTTKLSTSNFQPSTLGAITGPRIADVQVTDSSYTVLDDTAVDIAGGYIKITGTNFVTGCQVMVDMTAVSSVTFVSDTEVRAQLTAKDAGTYTVYVINPNGDTAVRIYGITFSATPAWVTGSTLTGDSGTAVSIQLDATGASTYALAAGSTLPANLTLTSAGLISGTVTVNDETLYNFTVVATDTELQDSPRSFSITITVGDPQFKYVTTLLSPTLPIVPFNDDASTNNFALTINGDTKPNNFGPYTPGYYSAYFDGTGDYLTVPYGEAFSTGSTFTIEAWVHPTVLNASNNEIFNITNSTIANFGGLIFYVNGSGVAYFESRPGNGGTNVSISGGTVPVNGWTHMAVSVSSNTAKLFVNGVQVASGTIEALNGTQAHVGIGAFTNGFTAYPWTGYISNLRVVKGTAVYTSAFTLPTAPLTAITNTSLLTCQSNRFIDNSTNNFAITRNGDTKISGFDPFAVPTEFAGRGSTYFDGTGDSLTTTTNTNLSMGTSNFTIECWIYPTAAAGNWNTILSLGVSTAVGKEIRISHRQYTYGTLGVLYPNNTNNGDVYATNTGYAVMLNTWTHIALCRSGSSMYLFANGELIYTYTDINFDHSTPALLNVANNPNNDIRLTGYLSDLRIIKGTAVYTSAFTPPTTPLTAVANTQLLTCQTNQPATNNVFLDSSTSNFLITRNGNTTQGAFSPYGGTWSNYFDGTGDYLTAPANAQFQFTGDFTIEGWVNFSNKAGSSPQVLFGVKSGTTEFDIRWYTTRWQMSLNAGSGTDIGTTPAPVNGVWTHVAAVRSGGSIKLYVDGVQTATTLTNSSSLGQTASAASVGASNTGTNIFTGYISNLRVINGTALYTANFTPPSEPLQSVAKTALLTCTDNRFADDSPNNFVMTRAGDVRAQKFNPFGIRTAMTSPSYSVYFSGSADYLTMASSASAYNFGVGVDFTVEAWVYPTVLAGTSWGIIDARVNGATSAAWIVQLVPSGGTYRIQFFNAGANTGTAVIPLNAWTHVAVVRNGTALRTYVNGVLDLNSASYGSGSISPGTTAPRVGTTKDGTGTTYATTGLISDLRVINGTALYTANFTPPTEPLTAITNTVLLTCQSSTLVDNSTNNFAITSVGKSQPSLINPFGFTAGTKTGYLPSVYSGSVYFDGTGDYLNSANPFTIATGPFTIEAWVYLNTVGTIKYIVDNSIWSIGNNGGWRFRINASNFILLDASTATYNSFPTVITATSSALTVGQWYHVACTRDSSNLVKLFVNGVSVATPVTYTNSLNLGSTPASRIGGVLADGGLYDVMNGYLSDVRVVPGTALYTNNFIPPAQPLTPVAGTILLMNGTASAIYDSSTVNDLETVGSVAIVTNIKPYGTGSFYFDGADYIAAPLDRPEFGFGTGDFTVELWVRNIATNSGVFFDTRRQNESRLNLSFTSSGTSLRVGVGTTQIIEATSITLDTWVHVAVTKASGSYRLFINGTQVGSTVSNTTDLGTTGSFCLGTAGDARGNDTYDFSGYLADVRVTKGYARYTANFTPPSSTVSTK